MNNFALDSIISYLTSPPSPTVFLAIKILFISSFLFFFLGIIYFLSKTRFLQWRFGEAFTELFTEEPYGTEKITESWAGIEEKMKSGLESNYKLAVVEADGILDDVLERIGHRGKNFDERLEQLTLVHLSNLNEVRKVHKIRSDIVRDPDYQLSSGEAKKALAVYKKALGELEAF